MTVGEMQMPPDFKYMSVYLKGKPRHGKYDRFTARHPSMDLGRRAKIFSPFDALKGFGDAVASREILYVSRPELTDEEKEDLSRKLNILRELTRNRRVARENRAEVRVEYFRPCEDENSDAWGRGGQRLTLKGICERVDAVVSRAITVDGKSIPFDDILALDAPDIFDELWETDTP